MYIYAIFVAEKMEEGEHGPPDFGVCEHVGFYAEKEEAEWAVRNNNANINEGIYNYAIIEKSGEGIYSDFDEAWFYKYDDDSDTYIPIEKPQFLKYWGTGVR